MAFESDFGDLSEAHELPDPDELEQPSEHGAEETGGDQDAEEPASAEQVEQDADRDQAEG
jgi:hypothetical protein